MRRWPESRQSPSFPLRRSRSPRPCRSHRRFLSSRAGLPGRVRGCRSVPAYSSRTPATAPGAFRPRQPAELSPGPPLSRRLELALLVLRCRNAYITSISERQSTATSAGRYLAHFRTSPLPNRTRTNVRGCTAPRRLHARCRLPIRRSSVAAVTDERGIPCGARDPVCDLALWALKHDVHIRTLQDPDPCSTRDRRARPVAGAGREGGGREGAAPASSRAPLSLSSGDSTGSLRIRQRLSVLCRQTRTSARPRRCF